MQSAVRAGLLMAAALLAFGSATEAAAAERIKGKLDERGYTVIALATNGKAKTDLARRGKFRVKPRAERVTLHLRAPDGTYAGPIVVRGKRRHAVLGVKAGARLGKIEVRRGYARPVRRLPGRWVDRERDARASHGVPIGARVFGRVRSKRSDAETPGDGDRDGIADTFDIDDDGDLILDNIERSAGARGSQKPPPPPGSEFVIHSLLGGSLDVTVNANAANLTQADIDAALSTRSILKITYRLGDSEELDCRGLVYCSLGGTGRTGFSSDPFPECCDPDVDGFGTMQPMAGVTDTMILGHGATSTQIKTGDVLIERVTSGGVETQFPTAVQYILATQPALVSYDDGQGHSATLSYPVPAGAPGTRDGNGFPVSAGPNGRVVVTLTLWRPPRRPIPPETGEWIDIGRLDYAVGVGEGGGEKCPLSAFSTKDPNLTVVSNPKHLLNAGGVRDSASDRPASPANTLTYKLDLTRCFDARGISFNPGESAHVNLEAGPSSGDESDQTVVFTRQ